MFLEAHEDIEAGGSNMTLIYVLLGSVFMITSSLIISLCVYCVILVIRFHIKRQKSRFKKAAKNILYKRNNSHMRRIVTDAIYEHNQREIAIAALDGLSDYSTSVSPVLSEHRSEQVRPTCREFCGVCFCLVFEDLPHCIEMFIAVTCGSERRTGGNSHKKGCCQISLHRSVRVVARISMSMAILCLVFYTSTAMDRTSTIILPFFTIFHLSLITLLLIGSINKHRSYLLPWMAFSWISWPSLLPCVFGSLASTKAWILIFNVQWVLACVVIYLIINLIFCLLVKTFYVDLIIASKSEVAIERTIAVSQQDKDEYHDEIDLPQIQVYKTSDDEGDDDLSNALKSPSSSHEEYPMTAVIASDFIDHSENQASSGGVNKMNVTADVAVAAIALRRANDKASHRHHEDVATKNEGKKGEVSKTGKNPEQRVPGMIHLPTHVPKGILTNQSGQRPHQGAKDRHGTKYGENKRLNKGQGKAMRSGARHGGLGRFDGLNSNTTNNNNDVSDSKEGEIFDFVVDVGGILEDQFNEQEELLQEFSPNRSLDRDSGGGGGGSRKGKKQRAGSFSTFLIVNEGDDSDRKQEKKLRDLAGNKRIGRIQSRSATNLTSSEFQDCYSASTPYKKKEIKFSDQGGLNLKSRQKRESSQKKTKMSKTKSRR